MGGKERQAIKHPIQTEPVDKTWSLEPKLEPATDIGSDDIVSQFKPLSRLL
jgi:hypothetical protein